MLSLFIFKLSLLRFNRLRHLHKTGYGVAANNLGRKDRQLIKQTERVRYKVLPGETRYTALE